MHHICVALLVAGVLGAPSPAMAAAAAGRWHVTGDVSGHGFVLDCNFAESGARLGGSCVEAGGSDSRVTPGKLHRLSEGGVSGTQVSWAYPVRVMLLPIDIQFAGTLAGNRIAGSVNAAGRKGSFTAVRS